MAWILRIMMLLLTTDLIFNVEPNATSSTDVCKSVVILNNGQESLGSFPSEVSLLLEVLPPGEEIRLVLTQDKLLLDDVAVHVIGQDGKTTRNREHLQYGNIRFYHDYSHDAVISMKIVHYKPGVVRAYFKGTLTYNGKGYRVEPRNISSYAEEIVHKLCELRPDKTSEKTQKFPFSDAEPGMTSKNKWNLNHSRVKRVAPTMSEYHVEIGIVVDHSIWEDTMATMSHDRKAATSEVTMYLGYIINGINMIYRSIPASSGLQIKAWLKEIYIAETREASIWTDRNIISNGSLPSLTLIDSRKALSSLEEWREKDGRNWTNPDHMMLFTRYDFFHADSKSGWGNTGHSYGGGICLPGKGVSLVEDAGLRSFKLAAQALAFNLGATPDTVNCSDYYMMYPVLHKMSQIPSDSRPRFFRFSPCTVASFLEVLSGAKDGYPRVCLHNEVCQQAAQLYRNYTLKEQCQMAVGPHSHSCDYLYALDGRNLGNVCQSLFCYIGQGMCIDVSFAQDGSFCGTYSGGNLHCQTGVCLPKSKHSTVENLPCRNTSLSVTPPGDCVDDPMYTVLFNQTKSNTTVSLNCDDIVRVIPHLCFIRNNTNTSCCRSCHLFGLVNSNLTQTEDGFELAQPSNRTAGVIVLTNPPLTTIFRSTTTTTLTPATTTVIVSTTPATENGIVSPYHIDLSNVDKATLVISLTAVLGAVVIAYVITVLVLSYQRKKREFEWSQKEDPATDGTAIIDEPVEDVAC